MYTVLSNILSFITSSRAITLIAITTTRERRSNECSQHILSVRATSNLHYVKVITVFFKLVSLLNITFPFISPSEEEQKEEEKRSTTHSPFNLLAVAQYASKRLEIKYSCK